MSLGLRLVDGGLGGLDRGEHGASAGGLRAVSGEPTGRQSERSQSAASLSARWARSGAVSACWSISAAVGSGLPRESVPWSSLR
jgi:hypothetical protein